MGGGFHCGLSFPSHLSPRSSRDEQIKCPLCAGRWEVSALREPVHGLAVLCPQRPSLERAQLSRDPPPFLISNGKKRPVSRVTFGGSVLCTCVLSIAQDDQYSASVRRSSPALLSQVTLHRAVFLGTLARIGLELASQGPRGVMLALSCSLQRRASSSATEYLLTLENHYRGSYCAFLFEQSDGCCTTVLVVMTSQNWDPSHLVVGTLATEAGGGEHLPQVSDRAGGVT